ncbi:hypothetical protein CV093_02430 [Oceanobacillus sp. 143]|uniref:Uncharacterized protein n=1 Tax=Oceanobacillus zhaokaii TaxID=2052660 RepID=A0A345PD12_9BACI|nr:hypothetical protein [Oceanobacillus zhaokaii]AXI07892.1 hypothetical protein CUC15_02370 [Oceanobacillus zhaokaii]QGS67964.1 hypothetical protein CV093_02430 [Oceanobacillus sp. 143]
MNQLALLFLAAVLAGFALIIVADLAASFITSAAVVNFLIAVGAIAVIVFALAIIYLALKSLFNNVAK